ncbi:hypothetical protein RM704_02750 [Streptomyces sp. DSM 3412]|uniref:Uncharacterized protein n=1 Tax=Streptomyces gottesmaniae TaxID=3075518 RepID=A0ABU2YQ28_9ACTN|nr:hypothetical protein [Streptomyces sp. DSM 3412]MDT0566405.1 hypothetical protein [Streptomyces sp. DSM 3412]
MSFLGVLVGLLVGLVPTGPSVAADNPCPDDGFTKRLACWVGRTADGPVVITLKEPLEYEDMGEDHRAVLDGLGESAHPVVVQVPKGARTGQGGTALLLVFDELLIHPDATIDRLTARTQADLKANGVCDDGNQLCREVGPGEGQATLKGSQLADFAADPGDNSFTITEVDNDRNPGSSNASGATDGQGDGERGDKGQDDRRQDDRGQGQGQAQGQGQGPGGEGGADNAVDTTDGDDSASGYSSATWTAFWMALLLALLLLAFVIVIRRSRGPVAVGHRAPSPGRAVGGLARVGPARTPPAHAARGAVVGAGEGTGGGGSAGAVVHDGVDGDGGDERTTRLRVASTPRHGRQVGARPAHARTAVVRTELHPQGYVEVDRVLRRAVWAEPGRPPPAPGGLVDVTDARERDSDVLYAFPPTAARHAKGTPR